MRDGFWKDSLCKFSRHRVIVSLIITAVVHHSFEVLWIFCTMHQMSPKCLSWLFITLSFSRFCFSSTITAKWLCFISPAQQRWLNITRMAGHQASKIGCALQVGETALFSPLSITRALANCRHLWVEVCGRGQTAFLWACYTPLWSSISKSL